MTEQDILLCSQPSRSLLSEAELEAAVKEDEKNEKQLTNLKNRIYRECYSNLFPLHRIITDMLDSYDLEYGYDRGQMARIINTYNRFERGYMVGANAKPEYGETLLDYALWTIESMGKAADDLESKVGFCGRFALGVATAGLSEVAFTTMDLVRVPYRMKTALERGKTEVNVLGMNVVEMDSDSFLGLFVAGAQDIVIGEVQSRLMGKAMELKEKKTLEQIVNERLLCPLRLKGTEYRRKSKYVSFSDAKKKNSANRV